MEILLPLVHVAVILGVGYWVGRKLAPGLRLVYWPALIVKLLAGIALGILYRNYYAGGDTFSLFQLAREQGALFGANKVAFLDFLLQNANDEWKGAARSVFFVKIASLVSITCAGNYWIASLWFSLLSFLGCLYLVIQLNRQFAGSGGAAAWAFLFFPSVVFWSSGIIKESLGLAALTCLSGLFIQVAMKKSPRWWEFLIAAVSGWILWNLKYYWFALFLPVTATTLLVQWVMSKMIRPMRWRWLLWIGVFLILCAAVSLIHPNFHMDRLLHVVVENNQAFSAASESGDLIHYYQLQPGFPSIALNAPWALVSGIFRPFPWEVGNFLQAAAAIENVVLLVLLISALSRMGRLHPSEHSLISMAAVVYILLLCIFLSLSTPNLGTLSRYRIGFLPFLVFMISHQNPLVGKLRNWPALKGLVDKFG